jgi:hypothetical protein
MEHTFSPTTLALVSVTASVLLAVTRQHQVQNFSIV